MLFIYSTARMFCGMENCSVGYDGYRDQIFLISACIPNHHIVEYLDCDFVGVRMVTCFEC